MKPEKYIRETVAMKHCLEDFRRRLDSSHKASFQKICLEYHLTEDNQADVFTKPIHGGKFQKLVTSLGLG